MIVFDIETGPIEEPLLSERLPQFDPESVKLGNLKDAEKIKIKIEEARKEHEAETGGKAALSALTGRILAVGYKSEKATILSHVAAIEGGEAGLLNQFWQQYRRIRKEHRPLVGHNISGFDVPFLVRRSWLLGVDVPTTVFDGRYLDRIFVDTMSRWQCANYRDAFVGLDALGRALGLGGKTEGVGGADFSRLYFGTPEERAKALEYLARDVELTWLVAQRLGIA